MKEHGRQRMLSLLAASSLALATGGLALSLVSGPAAAADIALGGFTVASTANAATFTYEQPNFPIPATPTLEVDLGYANATDNFGPTGSATAASLYPGQVVANAGPQLALLIPSIPLPPAPVWPIQAVSSFPQTPNTASSDQPGLTMEANSAATGNTATAAFGNANATTPGTGGGTLPPGLPAIPGLGGLLGLGSSGSGGSANSNPLAASSAVMGIQAVSSTATSTASGANAQASATAIDTGVSFLSGLLYLGSVTSTGTVTSDGTKAKITGSTTVADASLAGEPVSIDTSGIHAAANTTPAVPIDTLTQGLQMSGITITVTNPNNSVTGAKGTSQLSGLHIQIDVTQLDNSLGTLSKLLPAQLITQLPFALPNKQIFAIDIASVNLASTATPPFVFDVGGSAGTGGSSTSNAATPASSSSDGSASTSAFSPTGTGANSTSPASSSGSRPFGGLRTSAVAPVFKGIGAGLVVLGVLAAVGLMLAATRVTSLATQGLGEGGAAGPDEALGAEGYGGADVGDADPWDSALALEPEGPVGPGGAL